jgi:hypothetical protein
MAGPIEGFSFHHPMGAPLLLATTSPIWSMF